MSDLPRGAVTFLFTDIEGSTRLVRQLRSRYAEVLAEHQRLLRSAFDGHGGHEIDTQGDAFFYVFASAHEAVVAAVEGQRSLAGFPWPEDASVKVRIGIHTGQASPVDGRYTGLAVHRAARICASGHGGQVLVSQSTQSMIEDEEEELALTLQDLGEQRLKDIDRPVRLYQVAAAGLADTFPPLRHEEAPEVARRPAPPVYRRSVFLVAAGVTALAIAAAVTLFLRSDDGGSTAEASAAVVPNSLAVVDPRTSDTDGVVEIPGGPTLVAAGRRFAWVASTPSRTISSIAATTHAVRHVVPLDSPAGALGADGDSVWALDNEHRVLLRVDSSYGAVARRIKLPPGPPVRATNQRLSSLSVYATPKALWVTDGSTRLLRIDTASEITRALDTGVPLNDVAVGEGWVWAVSGPKAAVLQIDMEGRKVQSQIRVVNRLGSAAPFPAAVAVGEGSVWVLNGNTQTVSRIDPEQAGVTDTIPLGVGSNPGDLAAGAGGVWVANAGTGALARIDPQTNDVATVPLGNSPTSVAVGGGRVWVGVQPGFRASVASRSGAVGAGAGFSPLPASRCSPVESQGQEPPRYIIASDLPFQGQSGFAETLQMSDAIRFVLAEHEFRAGTYTVGYQACDSSTAATGSYDIPRCTANADAYAATRIVIGVIGGYNSGCVQAQLPVLARAPGGPLAMIGTASTYVGLTHAGPGTAPGEPAKYQPGGRRSYVRVVSADDLQGAANALVAEQLGARELFVLHDGDPYGLGIATNVRRAATKLGLRIAGFQHWDPHARTYTALARRVRRTGADAVFLGGTADTSNGVTLVRNLRSVLGAGVQIMAPDGFTPFAAFAERAGPAAEGMTISITAVPPERLRGEGEQFVARFGKAIGRPVEAYSVAAAQATEVLLDAIERSDGTRASVTREVFKTKVSNGPLGSFSFDRNGDTTAGAITIYRIERGKAAVFKVITPRPNLVR